MILLFTENRDYSSKIFLEWMVYYNLDFNVFLDSDYLEIEYHLNSNDNDFKVYKNGKFLCSKNDIKGVWVRREKPNFTKLKNTNSSLEFEYNTGHYLTRKENAFKTLEQCNALGIFELGNYNKIDFLQSCIKLGIKIPKTLITERKCDLLNFIKINGETIVKTMAASYSTAIKGSKKKMKIGYTQLLDTFALNQIPENFQLTLFQEKLDKKIEVRTFYLEGKCYSQAIFSQTQSESKIDYRQGYEVAMRQCNFKLPEEIEKQTSRLMNEIGLKTGSIDIVVTTQNDFVFLEVNPVGQFANLSIISNYQLEKLIATRFHSSNKHSN